MLVTLSRLVVVPGPILGKKECQHDGEDLDIKQDVHHWVLRLPHLFEGREQKARWVEYKMGPDSISMFNVMLKLIC